MKYRRPNSYTHNLECPYCDGAYTAPSRVALRKHISRKHRAEHSNTMRADLITDFQDPIGIEDPDIQENQ